MVSDGFRWFQMVSDGSRWLQMVAEIVNALTVNNLSQSVGSLSEGILRIGRTNCNYLEPKASRRTRNASSAHQQISTSTVRLSSRRSPSTQFRGEVEKWRSGEGMAETVQVFSPLDSLCHISTSTVRLSSRRSPSTQFRGEVEKWRSGEGMAETVQVFSPLDSLCHISTSTHQPFG
jgi:hypothetical protein